MELELENIWLKIEKDSYLAERNMSSLHRKQTGSYYTGLELAYEMMRELINEFEKNEISSKKILEPCVGTGNFVFSYLRVCYELKLTKDEYKKIVDGIYCCDINENALDIYKTNLKLFTSKLFGFELDDEYFMNHIGNGLLVNVDNHDVEYIPLADVFSSEIANEKFDIVVTNPPYKNLKAESSHYSSNIEKEQDKEKYKKIGMIGKTYFPYSSYGTLNLYKMFVEEIIERYTKEDGYCSLLIPSSILSDKNCSQLRTRIINDYQIKSIYMIPESSEYVDASQALCAILISKNGNTNKIKIQGNLSSSNNFKGEVYIKDIIDETTGDSILMLSPKDLKRKKQMESHIRLKNIGCIKNLRGELDITFNKDSIVTNPTSFNFYRGRNIGFYKTTDLELKEYVLPDFVETSPKAKYIHMERLACQQIANMSKKKRIAFTLVKKNSVLGNSCNFIAVTDQSIDLYFLMGILNSSLIEWYFNLTSSNNHINNYEIDNFPIPINCENKEKISTLVKRYIVDLKESLLNEINNEVSIAYGIKE